MPEPSHDPLREYRVAYSERVRTAARDLGDIAKLRGLGTQYLHALAKIDRILRVYPQYGEPLRDLSIEPMQLRVLTITSRRAVHS